MGRYEILRNIGKLTVTLLARVLRLIVTLGGSRSILLSYGDNYKILCVLPLAFFEKASDKVTP